MKYILMMTGTKAGVDTYLAWSQKDIQTHFAHLTALKKDLTESGEFVTTEGLAMPHQAKVVRVGANSPPITDGVFPEAKEFLLGYSGELHRRKTVPVLLAGESDMRLNVCAWSVATFGGERRLPRARSLHSPRTSGILDKGSAR